MTLNISAQLTTLTIGTQDWSAWIESIQIGYGEYEMGSGLKPCTGTVNLIFPANYANIPSNPEYRFNPSQWKRGQLIKILANTIALPCSGLALKIIKPPQRPSRGQNGLAKMVLSVGCAIAYEYFPPEPNDNFSGITAGTPKTRGAIINSILGTLKIASAVVIPEYSINYPLPKIDGNWLDFCGQLADSAGYYLRCNTNGVIIAEKILNAGSSGITYTIGIDESDWTAIGDVSEQPIEKLIITGVKKSLDPFGNSNVVYEYKTYAEIAPDLDVSKQNPFVTTVSKQTTVVKKKSAKSTSIIEEIKETYAKIAPDVETSKQNPFIVTVSKKTESKTFFNNGLITGKEEIISEPYAAIAPNLPVSQQNPFVVVVSNRTIQSWIKTGNQKYREIFTEYKTYAGIAPDLERSKQNPFVLTISNQKVTEGESAPPTDQPISDFNLTETQISSQVFASQLSPSDGRARQRTITLPFAIAVAQLTAYGQLFNKMLTGRAFGWRFATRLNTSLLPMQLITIIDNSRGYLFRTDALQWAMTLTEAHLVFNCIEVGVFNTATPSDISYPVTITMGEFDAIDNSLSFCLFNPFTVELTIGLSIGVMSPPLLTNESIGLSSGTAQPPFAVLATISLSNAIALFNPFGGAISLGLSEAIGIFTPPPPPAATLKAYWSFDDTSNTSNSYDSSSSYRFGSFCGGTSFTTGKINSAIVVGNQAYLQNADGSQVSNSIWNLSITNFIGMAAWIKWTTLTNQESTILFDGNNPYNYWIGVDSSSQPKLFVTDASSNTITLTLPVNLSTDTWYLFGFEINKNTGDLKLRMDDLTPVSDSNSFTCANNFAQVKIQKTNSDHVIDELKFYGSALSEAEWAALYNNGNG